MLGYRTNFEIGAKGRNRTGDTQIFSLVLYQLSYLGKRLFSESGKGCYPKRGNGGRSRNRTEHSYRDRVSDVPISFTSKIILQRAAKTVHTVVKAEFISYCPLPELSSLLA